MANQLYVIQSPYRCIPLLIVAWITMKYYGMFGVLLAAAATVYASQQTLTSDGTEERLARMENLLLDLSQRVHHLEAKNMELETKNRDINDEFEWLSPQCHNDFCHFPLFRLLSPDFCHT